MDLDMGMFSLIPHENPGHIALKTRGDEEILKTPLRAGVLQDKILAFMEGQTISLFSFKHFDFHPRNQILTKRSDKTDIKLTDKECDILSYFIHHQMLEATRDDLLRHVWGYVEGIESHTLETHIYRLRQKIEKDPGNPEYLKTTEKGYFLDL